jgi:hypothetical protein
MNTDQQAEKKREYDKKWREKHPGYDAARARKYREKFAANHVCTCLNCGVKFPGYRASYCSPECQKEARKRVSASFSEELKKVERRNNFQKLVEYVETSGIKGILMSIPRNNQSEFVTIQEYVRRHNLAEKLRSIPRVAE